MSQVYFLPILGLTGAEDVSSAGEASADWQKTDKPLPRAR